MNPRQIRINWTKELINAFKREYEEAVELEFKTFEFHGQEFYTSYAEMLLNHLSKTDEIPTK